MAAETAVEARGLRYSYSKKRKGGPTRPALAGLDFDVPAGRVFGFLGPNGGGKTTLFRILATLARPDSGSLRVFGADLATQAREVRRRLGVVFQSPSLDLQLTVRENLVISMGSETIIPGEGEPHAGKTVHRRYTHVWQRVGADWKLIARHANVSRVDP